MVLKIQYDIVLRNTAAALIGMIPEGLYLLTSVALTVSVIKLLEHKTLVQELDSVEVLARVNVLCLDKTGTITEPNMQVSEIVAISKQPNLDLERILNAIIHFMPGDNLSAIALKKKFNGYCELQAKKIHPFSSVTKWFAVEFSNGETYAIGAPEFILKENFFKIEADVTAHAMEGKRILLAAKLNGSIEKEKLSGEVIPLALILIENKVRKEAKETFNFFKRQGVRIVVLSGDNPVAVSTVCKQAGIEGWDLFCDASNLTNDDEIFKAMQKYSIFGRVSPTQKRKFIQNLKNQGKTVAMTGDGVNDVLALKDANIGIAMATGSSAAKQVSEIVLLDSNFNSLTKILLEGRRVINNIGRSCALFLVKNIFSLSLAILTLIFKIGFPISPFQFTWISALTIGIPAFLLTFEKNYEKVNGLIIMNAIKRAAPGGICNVVLIIAVQIVALFFKFKLEEISIVSAILVATNGMLFLFEICLPLNKLRKVILILLTMSMVLFIAAYIKIKITSSYEFSIAAIASLICLMVLNFPLLKLFKKLVNSNIFKIKRKKSNSI